MSISTREVVTKYFEAVNAGKWDEYLSLFADDIVMDEQLMGHIEGIKTVRDSIEGLRKAKKFKNLPVEIVVEGDKAMVQWHIETLGPNNEPIEAKGVNFYRIRDGKIEYFANFHDTKPFEPILNA